MFAVTNILFIFSMCKQHKHGANVIIKLQNDKKL